MPITRWREKLKRNRQARVVGADIERFDRSHALLKGYQSSLEAEAQKDPDVAAAIQAAADLERFIASTLLPGR